MRSWRSCWFAWFAWFGCWLLVVTHAACQPRNGQALHTEAAASPAPAPNPVETNAAIAQPREPTRAEPTRAEAARPQAAPTAQPAQTLTPETRTVLAVPEFLPAVLRIPAGNGPYALMVVTHGAGGAPEPECEQWWAITQARFALLCLRGKAMHALRPGEYYYPDHLALERELKAALNALQQRGDANIASTPAVYAGYSQGASMGALLVPAHAARFPVLVLVEGGFDGWVQPSAALFKKNGGKRVLFVCGTEYCNSRSQSAAQVLERQGLQVRREYVVAGGHTVYGKVGERVAAVFDWALTDGR